MNAKKLLSWSVVVMVVIACNGFAVATEPSATAPNTEIPAPSRDTVTPELAEPTDPLVPTQLNNPTDDQINPIIAFIPFNYTLTDQGDGWNLGYVSLAIENPTDLPVSFTDIEIGEVVIETKEGVTYPGELVVGYYEQQTNKLVYRDSDEVILIPPHFRFFSVDTGTYSNIRWKSAIAATPTRVSFPNHPNLSFDLPTGQSVPIEFPFDDVNTPQIHSFSSLQNTSLAIVNPQIEALFTGRCAKDVELTEFESPLFVYNQYYLEFEARNLDQFNEQATTVDVPKSYFYREGMLVQHLVEPLIIFDVNRGGFENEITLGPGQTKIGFITLGFQLSSGDPFITSTGPYPTPFVVFWSAPDHESFQVYDVAECQ